MINRPISIPDDYDFFWDYCFDNTITAFMYDDWSCVAINMQHLGY